MSVCDDPMRERIAQAEAAIAALGDHYIVAVRDEIAALKTLADQARRAPGRNGDQIAGIFEIAHNIKGQGGSFGFELMTEVGHSLCEQTRDQEALDGIYLDAIDHHIRVLSVIVEKNIRGDGGALGVQLLEKLQSITRKAAA